MLLPWIILFLSTYWESKCIFSLFYLFPINRFCFLILSIKVYIRY
nr:MAG TPA: hypothetical protein [Bacteriophage sp.]